MTTSTIAEAIEAAFKNCLTMEASLQTRLDALAGTIRALSPPLAAAASQLLARLQHVGAGSGAPQVGDPMPRFALPDDEGHLVTLDGVLEGGPVAITFHRGHWCPYCRINTDALARAHATIKADGGQVIMPDAQQFAAKIKSTLEVPFPILIDADNGYAMSLNLAIWAGDEIAQLYKAVGWDTSKSQGNHAWILPIPATFVVGTDGRICARFVDPDYRKRMAIDDLISALRASGT
jgi:peroxiredoxin